MNKRAVWLLAALIVVAAAAGGWLLWGRVREAISTRQLTTTVRQFGELATGIPDKTYDSTHPDFSAHQSFDDFYWYGAWIENHLGACKNVEIKKVAADFTAEPYCGAANIFLEYEKGTCTAEVITETVDGSWRIKRMRVELPALLGNFDCPNCGHSEELRRVCVKCGKQLLFLPNCPLLPEMPPEPPVDPALLSQYVVRDPAAEWRPRLYEQRDFTGVGGHLQNLLDKCDTELGAYEYTRFCAAMTKNQDENHGTMLSVLDAWAAEQPQSHFPLLLKGYVLTYAAWKVRGSGWNEEVGGDQLSIFVKLLKDAVVSLEQAQALNDKDPEPPSLLIACAQGLTLPRDVMEKLYAEALKRCPMNFGARVRKFEYLTPKWMGSWDDIHEFAKECAKDGEQWPMAGLIPAYERAEMHFRSKYYRYLLNKDRWAQYMAAYAKVFEAYPDLVEPHLELAYLAYKADEFATAKEQFEAVGDRWADNYYWKDLATYHRYKAITLAFLSASAPVDQRIKAAQDAIALAPQEPYPHFMLGSALANAERREEALSEYLLAAHGAPLHGDLFVDLAWGLGGFRRYGECYRAAERALLLQTDDSRRKQALEYLNLCIKKMGPAAGLVLVAPAA